MTPRLSATSVGAADEIDKENIIIFSCVFSISADLSNVVVEGTSCIPLKVTKIAFASSVDSRAIARYCFMCGVLYSLAARPV